MYRDTFHWSRLLQALSNLDLNSFRDGFNEPTKDRFKEALVSNQSHSCNHR